MTTRTLFGVLLLSAMPSLAADSDFNGRWDLTTLTSRARAPGGSNSPASVSPKPAGKFVSAYGGDMNTVDTAAVENGELRFTIANPGPQCQGTRAGLPRPPRQRANSKARWKRPAPAPNP